MVLVLVLGVGAQWLAWRLRAPAILLLLAAGVLAGPILGWLKPDQAFGRDLVLSFASLGVAMILFEGGLSLKWVEIRRTGAVIPLLVTVGLLAGWLTASSAAMIFAGFDFQLALLWGALMTVSGPTVIMPLLRQVRPTSRVRAILKWEAIIVDPIGAILAVIVFEALFVSRQPGWTPVANLLLGLFATGIAIGLGGAALVVVGLRRFWVPDYLHVPLTLALAVGAYALSGHIFPDSGLLAVTVMGMAMANQRLAPVEHILEFKENLRVLLISSLFVLLAARIELSLLRTIGLDFLALVAALVLVGRPVAVFLSSSFSSLTWKERAFLAGIMPRGIVAVAVATLFALRLEEMGLEGSEKLATYAILMVVATVIVYGLGAGRLALRLGVGDANPQGVLVLGAGPVGCALASAIKEIGFRALLVDRDPFKVMQAKEQGLEIVEGDILEEHLSEDLDLRGIGQFIAATASDEVNDLAVIHWTPFFGRDKVFRLQPQHASNSKFATHGRIFGAQALTHRSLADALREGTRVGEIGPAEVAGLADGEVILMSKSTDGKRLRILGSRAERKFSEGERLVALRTGG